MIWILEKQIDSSSIVIYTLFDESIIKPVMERSLSENNNIKMLNSKLGPNNSD